MRFAKLWYGSFDLSGVSSRSHSAPGACNKTEVSCWVKLHSQAVATCFLMSYSTYTGDCAEEVDIESLSNSCGITICNSRHFT